MTSNPYTYLLVGRPSERPSSWLEHGQHMFYTYLLDQQAETVVGKSWMLRDCPLARWLQSVLRTQDVAVNRLSIETGKETFTTPAWMVAFIKGIDDDHGEILDYGAIQDVTAARAAHIMAGILQRSSEMSYRTSFVLKSTAFLAVPDEEKLWETTIALG